MMPLMLPCLLLFTLMITQITGWAQTGEQNMMVIPPGQVVPLDDQLEKTAEALDLDQDYSGSVDDLMDLTENPVNLNAVKADELNRIPFLSPEQRSNLLNYLVTYGEVFSVYELQSIPGFDSSLIRMIYPYILISPSSKVPRPTPKNLITLGHHDLIVRYEQAFPKSSGFLAGDSIKIAEAGSSYLGSPQRYYFRYTYAWFDRIRIGFAGEKDPGEQFFRGSQSRGMDFYAAYLCLTNMGALKNLLIGNFRVTYGQGLTVGSGLSLGSMPGFSANLASNGGIRPSIGMNEGNYLRGLATTVKIKRTVISGFISYHPRDATISKTDSMSSFTGEISSFSTTGYHRTGMELAKRDILDELVCGGNLNFSLAPSQQLGFRISVTGLYYKYSSIVHPRIYPYNQFAFRGDQNLNTGIDFQIRYKGIYLFGEVTRSLNNGMAWLAGTTLTPDSRVGITLVYRNYQATYQNLFSNAFGQTSFNANECGIFASINAAVLPKVNLSGYIDLFSSPWLKYRVDSPSRGQEFGIMVGWQPSPGVKFMLRFYQKNTQINQAAEPLQNMHTLCINVARAYRFAIELNPVRALQLKTRIEAKEAGLRDMKLPVGYIAFQELKYVTNRIPQSLTLLFGLFDIPCYASRIYVYEPEVLYGYTVPAYQGKGIRTCLVLKFGIARTINIWVRGGITRYSDRQNTGSGLDMTEGNIKGEVTGQLLIKL